MPISSFQDPALPRQDENTREQTREAKNVRRSWEDVLGIDGDGEGPEQKCHLAVVSGNIPGFHVANERTWQRAFPQELPRFIRDIDVLDRAVPPQLSETHPNGVLDQDPVCEPDTLAARMSMCADPSVRQPSPVINTSMPSGSLPISSGLSARMPSLTPTPGLP